MNIGIVGCGNIAPIYLGNLRDRFAPVVAVKACADLDPERARLRASEFPGVEAAPLADLLADPDIGLILNLTTPQGHCEVARQALEAGKHVYNEKPLALSPDEGKELVRLAQARGLRIGAAPDTFLGAGLQACLRLLDEGAIGEPVAAQAFMLCRGHEHWHPNPDFYYKTGGGPLFDMGPYYLTALVALLGPVRRVTASARASFPERIIASEPRRGERIRVETPTHIVGVLEFAAGQIASLTTSFDTQASQAPRIELFGSKATLSLPDPNTFGGPVRLRAADDEEWRETPVTGPYAENARGLGVADMAAAIAEGRPHRASGELALHVLDIMRALLEAAEQGRHIEIGTTCARPPAME